MDPVGFSPTRSRISSSMSTDRKKEFQADLKSRVQKFSRENGNLSVSQALSQVTKEMLKNNPFVPPAFGCPINDLPNELLAYVFYVGMEMEEEGGGEDEEDEDEYEDELDLLDWDSDDEDEDGISSTKQKGAGKKKTEDDDDEDEDADGEDEPRLPFQVLVSHVCRHFREVAIESPLLWTTLHFQAGTSLEMAQTWLERSKGHPLQIEMDCTTPEDEEGDDDEEEIDPFAPDEDPPTFSVNPPPSPPQNLSEPEKAHLEPTPSPSHLTQTQISEIMNIIIPAVDRWRIFSVTASYYDAIHLILERFSKCSSAPLLEVLEMYHYEDCEEFQVFTPPELNTRFMIFGGIAPKLKSVALWGVHIDWDASLPLLNDLRDLEIAYHAEDVRPSFQTFSNIITSSPELESLSLCLSGPAGTVKDWAQTPIDIPSVKSLTLCHHEPAYIESLLPLLHLPNVVELLLDYDSADYTEFALLLAKPLPGRTKSILSGLDHLKIGGLPSNRNARQLMLEQLVNLKSICLNCVGDEEEFFERLMELKPSSSSSESGQTQSVVFCPHLTTLMTTGIDGSVMRNFVEVRKQGGAPLSKVSMSEEDDLDEREETWLREHLDELDFFEPSDSEEEIEVEIDDPEEMDDDDDDDDDDNMHLD
ncbi:hypothetical protein F5050DRAFT_1731399 [Lentinula boryana]|uniref:F-box domain-containing protein n=1 Tax=Lentinula boryana TaxID=40481 RepID=A0ABQ8QPV2_9AGAR|nr:hypothetical protein F5050DRAFT_1731399 [Lentinula boryana]